MNLDNMLSRLEFNRTLNPELLNRMGLDEQDLATVNKFISTGKVNKSMDLIGDYRNVDWNKYSNLEVIYSNILAVLEDKNLNKIVRLISSNLHNEDIKIDGLDLKTKFSFLLGYVDELQILALVSNIIPLVESYNISIRQDNIEEPYLTYSPKTIYKDKIKYNTTVIVPKTEKLQEKKLIILFVAFLDYIMSITLSTMKTRINLVKTLGDVVSKGFTDSKGYSKLVIASLKNGITINDMFQYIGQDIIDYEGMYKDLGIIAIPNGVKYDVYTSDGLIEKLSKKDILNLL